MVSWRDGLKPVDGNIDVHAHMLPRDCFGIPTASGVVELVEHNGQLHFGEFPIAISAAEISQTTRLLADMDSVNLAVRVVSPPPYAFAVHADTDSAAKYAKRVNEGLIAMCAEHAERLVPLGMLPVTDAAASREELERLADLGVAGVAVPPVVGESTLADPDLRHVLAGAAETGHAVLVHPMQQHRPGFGRHYLQNLVGNPVETATAIASCVLDGVFDEAPDLRIAFVHGAGCAPILLGRWDHGWHRRADVSRGSSVAPSEVVRQYVYADSLTHSDVAAELLTKVIDPSRVLLGSDYPFDMADPDPVCSATSRGFDLNSLRHNALRWLGA